MDKCLTCGSDKKDVRKLFDYGATIAPCIDKWHDAPLVASTEMPVDPLCHCGVVLSRHKLESHEFVEWLDENEAQRER